jgi:hypothetical protein
VQICELQLLSKFSVTKDCSQVWSETAVFSQSVADSG